MDGKIKLDIFGKEIDINPVGYVMTAEKLDESTVIIKTITQGEVVYNEPVHVKHYGKTPEEFILEFKRQNYTAVGDFISKQKPKLTPSDLAEIKIISENEDLGGNEVDLPVSLAIDYCEKTELPLYSLNKDKTELIVIRKIKNSELSDYKGESPNLGCIGVNIFTEEVTIAIDKNAQEILDKRDRFFLFPTEISVIDFEKKSFSEKLEIIKNK